MLERRPMRIERLGEVPYGAALAAQERHVEVLKQGLAEDLLMLLTHPPVITAGRNTRPENLLTSARDLTARGIEFFDIGRGGDVTYHGPGQLVGYPLLHLEGAEQDLRKYVHNLEEALIRVAADFGVRAARVEGLRGIWVGNNKLAAIGVRVARWTTMHGFALNVCCDLEPFKLIVPCGLVGRGVTSLSRELNRPVSVEDVEERVVAHLSETLGRAPCIVADENSISFSRRTAS